MLTYWCRLIRQYAAYIFFGLVSFLYCAGVCASEEGAATLRGSGLAERATSHAYSLQLAAGKQRPEPVRYQVNDEKISQGLYFTSGVVTTGMAVTVPFAGGVGHFIQGRYAKGTFFLASPLVAIGGLVFTPLVASPNDSHGMSIFVAWGFTFIALKLWEVVDIWAVPTRVTSAAPRRFSLGVEATGSSSFASRAQPLSLSLNLDL